MAPTLDELRTPRQAWGSGLSPKYRPFHRAAVNTSTEVVDTSDLVHKLQDGIKQRKLQPQDLFREFDALRHGRIHVEQFGRVVNQMVTVPFLDGELQALMAPYREGPANAEVNYGRFLTSLVTAPMAAAERKAELSTDDEVALVPLFKKLGKLIRTRRVIFRSFFADADKSHSTRLSRRNCGKVSGRHFITQFPFSKEILPEEMDLLLRKYSNDSGEVNFAALDQDLIPFVEDSLDARHLASGRSTASPSRAEPAESPQEDATFVWSVVEKIKAVVNERRLRLHGTFQEFDRKSRGFCSMAQVNTVLTILKLSLSEKELKALETLFCTAGEFNYREFCKVIADAFVYTLEGERPASVLSYQRPGSVMTLLPASPATLRSSTGDSLRRYQLRPESEGALLAAIDWIVKKTRQVALKTPFQDFDKHCSGRVSKHQFLRIAEFLQLQLTPEHQQAVLEAFMDPESKEVNYQEFVSTISKRAEETVSFVLPTSLRSTPLPPDGRQSPSKYFDRKGQVVPLAFGLIRPFTQ